MITKDRITTLKAQGCPDDVIKVLEWGTAQGLNMEAYAEPSRKAPELAQIVKGKLAGLDTSVYDQEGLFDASQMCSIRKALEKGVDVSCFLDPKYSGEQMKVIGSAIDRGADVSCILDPSIPPEKMMNLMVATNMQKARSFAPKAEKTRQDGDSCRFALASFSGQVVDLCGTVSEMRMCGKQKLSLLLRNITFNGDFLCTHAWASLSSHLYSYIDRGCIPFSFGDEIQFRAGIYPYRHKDGDIHYGIEDITNIQVLTPKLQPSLVFSPAKIFILFARNICCSTEELSALEKQWGLLHCTKLYLRFNHYEGDRTLPGKVMFDVVAGPDEDAYAVAENAVSYHQSKEDPTHPFLISDRYRAGTSTLSMARLNNFEFLCRYMQGIPAV